MFSRTIETDVQKALQDQKIVLIVGARQVGKTTLLKKYHALAANAGSAFYINLENPAYLKLLNESPEHLFQLIGPPGRQQKVFIDEIQKLNDPSTFLKYLYDEYHNTLKLVVTGSSAFYINKKFTDSLAGRKHLLTLHSLSLAEYFHFIGKDELTVWIQSGNTLPLLVRDEIDKVLNDYLVYGGYPEVVLLPDYEDKKQLLYELVSSYVKKDIYDAGIQHEDVYYHLFQLLASQTGSLVNYNELANTLVGNNGITIRSYLTVMRSSFHVALITPYFSNKRKELTKMPKSYFYDTGIRNAVLQDFTPYLLRVGAEKGALLENFIFKRLLDTTPVENIHFRRNTNGNEIDFVVGSNAWEVKATQRKYSSKKYASFQNTYPDISLDVMTLHKAITHL